ncbi:hypothetical protein GCG54_00010053 [Colletotrichum gloeosporioides]|uniref:Uncharacterized protein n=1 Tax=Colletotrichum gloeosporioides TaxID=474922 RepID=A0A8H4C9D6_COLGL|nr:uncharacterized protein GCG54_00010053 [Colletotrichum gloeosporioides]KAF3799860.1 hypothetical protein GCG54_00010053 [Colletotrichum gloeosporioides]
MANFIQRFLLKETASGDAPLYNRLNDDENGNGNLVSKEDIDRPSTNKSVATMLSFFILGFLVAMTISAIIAFLVPVGLHDGLHCAESP